MDAYLMCILVVLCLSRESLKCAFVVIGSVTLTALRRLELQREYEVERDSVDGYAI